jgi:uncharacterized protein (TIGR00730 family)
MTNRLQEPQSYLMKRIGVFCGSRSGTRPEYTQAAQQLGTVIAQQGYELVYGGAHVGLMGILANSALEAGGRVIGVIPQKLVDVEIAHRGLSELHIVNTMHERKAMMAERSDAFIALPGGFGTLEELFEIITWGQLGLHHKPFGILNIAGYYDGLISFFNYANEEGFIHQRERDIIYSDTKVEGLITQLEQYKPVTFSKWDNDRVRQ